MAGGAVAHGHLWPRALTRGQPPLLGLHSKGKRGRDSERERKGRREN